MTMDNWLMIVVIISTLMAPTVAVLVQSRMNQPKQTPIANHPPNRSHRKGGWFTRLIASDWLVGLSILIGLLGLVFELRRSEPLDRWGVLLIAILVAGIVLGLGALAFMSLSRLLERLVHSYTRFIDLYSLEKDLSERLDKASRVPEPEPPSPP